MNKSILTDALIGQMKPIMFPKPIKEKKRYGYNSTIPLSTKRPKTSRKAIRRSNLRQSAKRSKLPSIKSLKAKADRVFSEFIRARDKKCCLCDSTKGLSAGHLIKRGKMATRYDENNVFGLCSSCNFRDFMEPSYHDIFIVWYIKNYGAISFSDLVNKSRTLVKTNRLLFQEIIDKYEKINSKRSKQSVEN